MATEQKKLRLRFSLELPKSMSGSLGEPKTVSREDDMLASAIFIDFLGFPQTFRVFPYLDIFVPRGRAAFGQHQESRPLAKSNTGSPRFTDFPSLCACSESSLTNLIGSGLNLLCLQSHSKKECRWTRPEVAILGADQKERGLWGREWYLEKNDLKFL